MSRRALIIVNYFTADLTRTAVATARASSEIPLDVIIVDNSVDARELAALRSIPDCRVIAMHANSGYSGGINRGVREVSCEVVILANPDVEFGARCIDRLVAALEVAAVSGPRFHWDRKGEWFLPPVDEGSTIGKLAEILASHSAMLRGIRDRSRIRRRRRFWSSDVPSVRTALSGAVMAMRTSTLRDLGGFDETFELYFEEIDFFRRLLRNGGRAVHVSNAHCRHLYNQSGRIDGSRERKFRESEAKYHAKWGSDWLLTLPAAREPNVEFLVKAPAESSLEVPPNSFLELSPLSNFASAAGWMGDGILARIPAEIIESVRPDPLYLRILDRSSLREIRRYQLVTDTMNGQ